MQNLVPIGRFSKICRLTVKALRHYDELGLLRPALVDPESGYRYYSLSQTIEAERIRLLRSLKMSLDGIRELLAEPDPDKARQCLHRHYGVLEQRLEEYRCSLAYLERLLNQENVFMAYEVKLREVSVQPVAGIRLRTSLAAIGPTIGQAFGELFMYLGRIGQHPTGAPMTLYHDPEFREEDMDIEVCVPVESAIIGLGRIQGRDLPARWSAPCTAGRMTKSALLTRP